MQMENPNPHDPLERATAALRETPTPDGPSTLVVRRTLAALLDAESRSRPFHWRLAAAAAILGMICGAAIVLVTVGLRGHGVVARQVPEAALQQPSGPHLIAGGHDHRVPPRTSPVQTPAFASRGHESGASEPPREVQPATPVLALASDVAIAGRVYFDGMPPARRPIDTRACADCLRAIDGPIYDDSLQVNDDGTLAGVVVSISAGLPPGEQFPVPAEPVVLDQKGCMFRPHVIAAMIGQPILLRNSDPILHNIRSTDADEAPAFDLAQPAVGERRVRPLRVVETMKIKCNLHPWMTAWVRTFDHPFFDVTGVGGTYNIRGLPPGTYRLKIWHERLGVQERTVTFAGGEPVVADFTYHAGR